MINQILVVAKALDQRVFLVNKRGPGKTFPVVPSTVFMNSGGRQDIIITGAFKGMGTPVRIYKHLLGRFIYLSK